jgi:hypothetical protein
LISPRVSFTHKKRFFFACWTHHFKNHGLTNGSGLFRSPFQEISRNHQIDQMRSSVVNTTEISHAARMERIELYFRAHPRSHSAVRRPKLFLRARTWVALLGPSVDEGIVGFGATPEAALHAFDGSYLRALLPQDEGDSFRRAA